MLYAFICKDIENSLEKRLAVRPTHLERITALQNQGRLVIAGPHPTTDSEDPGPAGFSGSLIVAEFPSLEEAQNWIDEDPYVTAGVFSNVNVKPFKKALP